MGLLLQSSGMSHAKMKRTSMNRKVGQPAGHNKSESTLILGRLPVSKHRLYLHITDMCSLIAESMSIIIIIKETDTAVRNGHVLLQGRDFLSQSAAAFRIIPSEVFDENTLLGSLQAFYLLRRVWRTLCCTGAPRCARETSQRSKRSFASA